LEKPFLHQAWMEMLVIFRIKLIKSNEFLVDNYVLHEKDHITHINVYDETILFLTTEYLKWNCKQFYTLFKFYHPSLFDEPQNSFFTLVVAIFDFQPDNSNFKMTWRENKFAKLNFVILGKDF